MRPAPAGVRVALVLALASSIAACGTVDGTFPATSTCPSEPRGAGTVPELEALLPLDLGGESPDTVDSGWNCVPETLGTYAAHGVARLEFAGATWDDGDGEGAVAAVFRAGAAGPPLEAAWVEQFYEEGARGSRNIENVETRRPEMDGAGHVWRLDALNNLSLQSIVAWPHGQHVHVVLVASTVQPGASREAHEARVAALVAAAASVPGDITGPPPSSGTSPATSPAGPPALTPAP